MNSVLSMAIAAALAVCGFVFEWAIPGVITAIEAVLPEALVATEILESGELITAVTEASVGLGEGDAAIAGAVREILPVVKSVSEGIGAGAEVGRQGVHAFNNLTGREDEVTTTEKVFGGLSSIAGTVTNPNIENIKRQMP